METWKPKSGDSLTKNLSKFGSTYQFSSVLPDLCQTNGPRKSKSFGFKSNVFQYSVYFFILTSLKDCWNFIFESLLELRDVDINEISSVKRDTVLIKLTASFKNYSLAICQQVSIRN